MEVNIQIQRPTKALDQCHSPRMGSGLLVALPFGSGRAAQVGCQCAVYDAQHFPHDLRLSGKEKPEGVGDTEHPAID